MWTPGTCNTRGVSHLTDLKFSCVKFTTQNVISYRTRATSFIHWNCNWQFSPCLHYSHPNISTSLTLWIVYSVSVGNIVTHHLMLKLVQGFSVTEFKQLVYTLIHFHLFLTDIIYWFWTCITFPWLLVLFTEQRAGNNVMTLHTQTGLHCLNIQVLNTKIAP